MTPFRIRVFNAALMGAVLMSLCFGPQMVNGQAPSPVAFQDAAGRSLSLVGMGKGQATAVIILKDWDCSACTSQVERLWAMRSSFDKIGGRIVVVAQTDHKTNVRRARQLGPGFDVYADPTGSALRTLGFQMGGGKGYTMPGVIFLDKCGEPYAEMRGRRPGAPQEELILHGLKELSKLETRCPDNV